MNSPVLDGPRASTKAEVPEMIAMVNSVMRQGSDQSFMTDYPQVYDDANLENIFILKAAGEMACVVPFIPRNVEIAGCRFRVGIISPTATAPLHRRKGYALRCLRACTDKMTRDGIELSVLWTLVPTFKFYEHGGYQGVDSPDGIYGCRKTDAALFSDGGQRIAVYDPGSRQWLDDMRAMHEQEVTGIVRGAEDYAALFSLPKMKTLIALDGSRPVGYLLVSRATNKPGLVEAGGSAVAVETLVGHALNALDGEEEMAAYSYQTSTLLGNLLDEKLPERRQPRTADNMMVRLNNVRDFMQSISPWLAQRSGPATRTFSMPISDNEEPLEFEFSSTGLKLSREALSPRVELSRRELTSIVFGPHAERPVETPQAMRGLFPFYFPIWILDHS